MELSSFNYTLKDGWSIDPLPELDSEQTLVTVFGGSEYINNHSAIDDLRRTYPTACMIGCSTSGEIFGATLSDESLAVSVTRFESTKLRSADAPIEGADHSRAAGRQIAKTLNAPSLTGLLVLSDGLKVNGSELVSGINEVLSESVVVTGGLAGDGERFDRTWVLKDGKPQSGFVTAVGFYGQNIQIGHGSKGGWDKFGPERLVTRSEGNVLYELDGQPALELYKKYLGDRASGLPATGLLFPLALRANSTDYKQIVRTILAVDEADQSMTFAGDIPHGYLAQLMKANLERLIDGASDAALMTKDNTRNTDSPTLSVAISCVGRRLVLGQRTEDELESALDILPKNTQQVGFYSYGEISPFASGHCDLHNQTMTLTTIKEI